MKWLRLLPRAMLAAALLCVLAGAVLWLRPPALLRIGANFTAKIVCSNVFIAHRDPQEVLRVDVQAPGHPLLKVMRVTVDREQGLVRAGLWGFIGDGLAVARPEGGCTAVPDGDLQRVMRADAKLAQAQIEARPVARAPVDSTLPWPQGGAAALDQGLNGVIADDALAGPGMRAIVVVHRGRIVAERYGSGFGPDTPQLGWSMTKSVLAGLVGVLIQQGRLTADEAGFWPAAAHDGRSQIRIADLMSMSSGLRFNEGYGAVSDITRMLYTEPDMAGFAAAQPLVHSIGSEWSYSSGSALILSRIVQDSAGVLPQVWARENLFAPLGMHSAVMEVDEQGTLVGSSYLYATARDWARYGQFLLQGGEWDGRALLPAGFVGMMSAPAEASHGEYGRGLVWLDARAGVEFALPVDLFWMEGHDGQSIAVIPSRQLVVVRLGLTPSVRNYRPHPLIHALLDVLARQAAAP